MIGEQGGFGLVSLLRGLLGIITILGIAYAMSYDRKRIDWKLVGGGLFMQIVFALAVLYVPFVGSLLEGCGKIFVKLMDFTDAGLTFLLGPDSVSCFIRYRLLFSSPPWFPCFTIGGLSRK